MNGPPLVVYGSLQRWSPEHFRASLQGYFLPASSFGMCGYALAGLWTRPVTVYYLWSLVPALIAILLGRVINRRMKDTSFIRYVHVGLILIGAVLLMECAALHFRQHEADRSCFPRPRVERSAELSNLTAEPLSWPTDLRTNERPGNGLSGHLRPGYPVVSAPVSGYRVLCSRGRFSSSLCDRTMLRRPSTFHPTPREEGCSSTAFDTVYAIAYPGWCNLADRGSVYAIAYTVSAVP
jgi:hypothetical protein